MNSYRFLENTSIKYYHKHALNRNQYEDDGDKSKGRDTTHAVVAVAQTECVVWACGWVGGWVRGVGGRQQTTQGGPRKPTKRTQAWAGQREAHAHLMSDFRGRGMISAAFEGETYPDAHMPMSAQH